MEHVMLKNNRIYCSNTMEHCKFKHNSKPLKTWCKNLRLMEHQSKFYHIMDHDKEIENTMEHRIYET
jgi:hypothetical protein